MLRRMEPVPVQESREPVRLFAPSRISFRPARPAGSAGQGTGEAPWTSDHPWRLKGQGPDYWPEERFNVIGRVSAIVAVVVLHIVLASMDVASGWLMILDLVGLVFALDLFNRFYQSRYGRLTLWWSKVPFFTGERLDAVLIARPALEPIGPVLAILRCVRDERALRQSTEGEEVVFEPLVIYRQTAEFHVPGEQMKKQPLSFEIPADLPGTDLAPDDATYWQIAVQIPLMSHIMETVFLAPVYRRRP